MWTLWNMREIKNDQIFVASIAESSFHDDSTHDQIMPSTLKCFKIQVHKKKARAHMPRRIRNCNSF
ncbi:hypothetical protein RchiOBHm_Chr3g0488751 [Rosa chinensis]|uniref:Uncharacterized protein n=1 Tax=Rosa chinensis TaxID=74649 RepID=A0A2P6RFX6_ROSCH|nr:hypothetical protein RchiOBHm_Chr3g0488751 [Rosa chinensis]